MNILDWLRGKKEIEETHTDQFPQPVEEPGSKADDAETEVITSSTVSETPSGIEMEVISLIDELEEAKYPEWFNAYEALEKIGSPAVLSLLQAIESDKSLLRGRAMDLLGTIGDERAIDSLERASHISLEDFGQLAKISGSSYVTYVGDMRIEVPLSELWEEYRENAVKALESVRERLSAPSPLTPYTSKDVSQDSETESLLAELGRRDLLGPNPAIGKLREQGEAIVPQLLRLLDGDNVTVAEDVIRLLGEMGATQSIPKLQALTHSQWAEVSQAAYTALAVLENKGTSELQFDRQQPFEQVGRLWTAIIQGRQELYPSEVLNGWCMEAIDAMPSLEFSSKENQAKAWGMVGSLVFKSMNPEWPGGFDGTKPCPEAKRCYEEALRAEPGDDWWQGWVKRFS